MSTVTEINRQRLDACIHALKKEGYRERRTVYKGDMCFYDAFYFFSKKRHAKIIHAEFTLNGCKKFTVYAKEKVKENRTEKS